MGATIANIVDFIADFLTVIASIIAISIWWTQRKKIGSALKILLNFSLQMTLTELYGKLEKVNGLNADDPTEGIEVLNILKDIEGQIKGNSIVKKQLNGTGILRQLASLNSSSNRIQEYNKRTLVALLREKLKHIDATNQSGKT